MFLLDCAIQTYAWGKVGSSSLVAQYKASHSADFVIDAEKPYAELWMGTHSNGPSLVKLNNSSSVRLNEHLKGAELPFLFKVLSVNQALSIQAHPNKTLAAVLHANDPKNYPDANHKPEMLIALTRFQGLCGFRPKNEIQRHLTSVPPLVKLCGEANVNTFNASLQESALKACFSSMMSRGEEFIRECFDEFLSGFKTYGLPSQLNELFTRLHQQYPFDIGCFSIFLLNFFDLEPNEAVYLKANVPHAYLYGDGVECMACSDNVVRAGLTPKFKDVKTLVEMLDYSMNSLEENLVKAVLSTDNADVHEYKPDVDEFSVQRVQIDSGDSSSLPVMNKHSILIVINGTAHASAGAQSIELKKGYVLFVDKNTSVHLSNSGEFLAFRAYCNQDL